MKYMVVFACLALTVLIALDFHYRNQEPTDWENMGTVKATRMIVPTYGIPLIEIDTEKGTFRVPADYNDYIPNNVVIFWSKEKKSYKINKR